MKQRYWEEVIRWVDIDDNPFSNLNLEKSIAGLKSRRLFRNVEYEVSDGLEQS